MKYILILLLCSCATQLPLLRTQTTNTACGAAFELKVEGYFSGCDYVELNSITKTDDGGYMAEGVCKHYGDKK